MVNTQGLWNSGIYGYISAQGVQNLATYKYSGVDKSILVQLFMRHFWNWLIDNVVPTWIAPNLLTTFGFLSVLSGFTLLMLKCHGDVEGWAPNWVYAAVAFFIFFYQTMDNLDGKQARKTGSSSALGEAFDHGADSLTVPMFALIMGTSFQFGPFWTLITLFSLIIVFYLAHWECYFTNTLLLRPLANPTEAQLSLITLLLWTSYQGTMWWRQTVNTIIFGEWEHRHIFIAFTMIGLIGTIYDHVTTVLHHIVSRGGNLRSAGLALVPLTVLLVFSSLWPLSAPVVLIEHARLYILTIGLMFSYLAIRLIVQNITKEGFRLYYNMLSPLILITFHSFVGRMFVPVLEDAFILQFYFLVVLLHDGVLIASIVTELSIYLGIRVFVISKPEPLPSQDMV
jgi:ethanolaminephosphotransferase